MRRNRGLLGSIQEVALVDGQTPVWWQSEIAQSTVRLDDLKRACVWVESWEVAVRAVLHHGPLLGHSLAELMDRFARQAGVKLDAPRSKRPQPARPEYRRTRDREEALTDEGSATVSPSRGTVPMQEGDQVSEETVPHRSRPDPFQLEPHASGEVHPETHGDWLRDLGRWADRSLGQWGLDVFRTAQQASSGQQDIGEAALLGHSLAELTDQITDPAGSKPEKTRHRQSRFAWPEYRPARNRQMAPASKRWAKVSHSGSPVTAQQGDQVWEKTPGPIHQMESQASQALLYRLAGATAAAQGSHGIRRRPTGEPMKPKAVASPSVPRDSATHRNWLRDLARRAGGSLLQEGHDDDLSAPLYASSDQPGLGELLSLAEQWALPLNGPPAYPGLLGRLVCVPESDGPEREEQPGVAPRHPSARRSPDQDAAPATEHARPWHAVGMKATESSQAVSQPTVADRMENTGGESVSPVRIAPPAAATSLPPLLPPQIAGKPSSLAATAIIQGVARQEEAAATENDQSALATKIKRILDDEARRHGIDV